MPAGGTENKLDGIIKQMVIIQKSHPQVRHPKELLRVEETAIVSFNKKVVQVLASILGNIWFFYACVLLDLIMLPPVIAAHSTITWVTYIAQTVIQLVALPILQLYQNFQQASDQAKADADYQTLTYLATLQDSQMKELKLQTEILNYLKSRKP